MTADAHVALPQGYALNEYRIESTLGVGGFGLTYLATDANLDLKVAIKEYLPDGVALRCADQSVRPKSDAATDMFKWGLTRFLDESRTLASFRHANIVRVMRFFEANKTAYMVMEFVAGQALGEWIKPRRPLSERTVIAVIDPLLDGLDVIHRTKYLHRDIKPNNIFIREDNSPVLLDFGSARMARENTEMTAIVTPGYAPFEQYHAHGNQGPWSDLYAMGAVLYWIVTGVKPVESVARIRKDVMMPAAEAGDRSRYSAQLLKAIDWALSPLEEARPQSVAEFRSALHPLQPAQPHPGQTGFATSAVFDMPASEKPTVLATAVPSAGAGTGQTGFATGAVFDREMLKKIEMELATHIGPIAPVMVTSAAKKSFTLAQLAELVAADIADAKVRAAFVKKFSGGEKSVPTGNPTRTSATMTASAPSRFDAATLARAEAALAKHIGAVARVVVRRAAAKARDEAELYLLLSDQIEDKNERKAFVRKALTVSGRP